MRRHVCNHREIFALIARTKIEEERMKKALAILATVATVGATMMSAPA